MATIAAVSSTKLSSSLLRTSGVSKASTSRVQGLPALRASKIVCKAESSKVATVAGVTIASTLATAFPSLALVDERLSGEGTGLSLGLNNPSLGWILFGVATLIWALYFTYSSKLPEGDDDSGLSL